MTDRELIKLVRRLGRRGSEIREDQDDRFACHRAARRLCELIDENDQMARELADKVEDDERLRLIRDRAFAAGRESGLKQASGIAEKAAVEATRRNGPVFSSPKWRVPGDDEEAIYEVARGIECLLNHGYLLEEPRDD